MNKVSFGNISFRGLTLISKFIFVFFLGRYSIDETNLGVYGMLITAIAFLIYFLGFDFYVFNMREIIQIKNNFIPKIRDQLYFHLSLYLLLMPLSLAIIFGFNFIEIKYLVLFIILLISEHLGQELFRLLTTLEKSLVGNFFFFVKSGLWIWYILFDFFFLNNEINIFRYILIWSLFSWFSLLIGLIYIKRLLKIKNIKFYKPNISWILKGIKSSSIFFMSSLSFLVIQFSDRFMIDFYHGKNLVGVYTTYSQFINAIDVFTFSGIIMVTYPKMIKFFSDKNIYKNLKNNFFKNLLAITIVLVLGSYFLAPFVFEFLEKPSFINYISTYNILLIGVFFLVMSNVFHYDLYAKKRDYLLLKIAITSMSCNIILNLILIPKYEIYGASIATLFSFIVIFMAKFFFSLQKISTENDSI
ncbi:MAG: hypothetical protein GKR88_20720 [Flavobacteriaceae bacterium]|nr:MAG: hypothetical protein GKR88_20720 [Flavobacteriaceae bacterium]